MAFSSTRMLMAAGKSSLPPTYNATFFDATATSSDLHVNGAAAVTAGTTCIFSFWINLTALQPSGSNGIWSNLPGSMVISISPTGKVVTNFYNAAFSQHVAFTSNTTLSTGTWYNILTSVNTSTGVQTMYINNVADTGTPTFSTMPISLQFQTNCDFSTANSPIYSLNGCLSEFYFAANQFLDFTVSGNRALFISGGQPVNLGSNGQIPTGTSPTMYWRGNHSSLTNLGSGGGTFSVIGDALTACGSAP